MWAFFAQIAADPLSQVERAQSLVDKPNFVAAVGWVAAIAAFLVIGKMLVTRERRDGEHTKAHNKVLKEYADKVEKMHESERERIVKLEMAAHGMLEMVGMLRELLYDTRRKSSSRKEPKTNPGLKPGDGDG